jgi:hypothetical protein
VKIFVTLAGLVLLGTSLAACSDGDGDAEPSGSGQYCKDIAKAKPIFQDLASGDLAQLEKGFATFHRLADKATAALKDDWKVLDAAATSVETSLKEAGLTFADLTDIQQGRAPEGADLTKLTGFAAELQKLYNSEFTKARTAIADHAKDSCNVELGAAQP